ncbi:MAG: hypothetical protein GWN31_12610 [Candidatus Thorarchaeota archaeon]|nr:hypothetical protein [Candidatus Thorarchaeota archaeon]NIW52813.1 hypothetical protein [Candidatus Korarchaeota archaeon]
MQDRALILAGGWGYTSYSYALAQELREKASLCFVASEGNTTRIVGVLKDVEKNLDRYDK